MPKSRFGCGVWRPRQSTTSERACDPSPGQLPEGLLLKARALLAVLGQTGRELCPSLKVKALLTTYANRAPDSRAEEVLLSEALCRGATRSDLFLILTSYQKRHPDSLSPAAILGLDAGIPPSPDVIEFRRAYLVDNALRAYRVKIANEFGKLDPDVQKSFWYGDTSKGEDQSYLLQYYSAIRSAYYNYGYNDPCGTILSQIRSVRFLGKRVLLHEKAAKRLELTEVALKKAGVADNFSKATRSVGGFVPRFIAPRQGVRDPHVLSNHAFGLAIDIEGDLNPHIKDRDVIRVIREITGFDFGHLLIAKGTGLGGQQRTEETRRLAVAASMRLQVWLEKYVPLHDSILREASGTDGRAAQESAWQTIVHSVTSSRPESPVDGTAVEMTRLGVLYKFHGKHTVRGWMLHGILTLPAILISALTENEFKWGGEYIDTKDLMHFELLDFDPRKVLKPDSSERRSLSDLFNDPRSSSLKASIQDKQAKHLPK
jgi:hypothetical protein